MIFQRVKQNKKAQTVKVVVMLVVGLVVVGMMIYLGYKYILGTGESVGKLGSCQGQGGECRAKDQCSSITHKAFFGMGCPAKEGGSDKYCCIPNRV